MAKKKYYQRPDGLYETTRTVNGKKVRFRGRTCAEVDRKILEYDVRAKKGRKVPEIADEWYKAHEADIAYSTWKVYGVLLDGFKEAFPKQARSVKPLDVMRYVAALTSKGYAKGTVQIALSVAKQIFSYAVLQGDIDANPAAEVTLRGQKQNKKIRHALTEEEEKLVENYRGKDWLFGIMLLYTGCRRGELLALEWKDIDRKAGVIHITKKINYAYGNHAHLDHHLKNADARDVPLFGVLDAVLPKNRVGKIFPGESGDYMTVSELRRMWVNYREAVGLRPEITPHCFRHSFATICYEAGIDPKSAAAFLGDTEAVTQKVYTELRARHHVNSAEMVNAYLEMRAAKKQEQA